MSEQAKHTPGPYSKSGPRGLTIVCQAGHVVAHLKRRGTLATTQANANLFVAAPDLLEACKACDKAFVAWQLGQIPGRPEDILALIQQIRAAIAKTNEEGGDEK